MTKRIKLKMGHQYQCYVQCVIGRWNRLDNCWCTLRKLLKWNHWHFDLVDSDFGQSNSINQRLKKRKTSKSHSLLPHLCSFLNSPYCSHIIPKLHISMCATWANGLYVLSIFDVLKGKLCEGKYFKIQN